MIHNEIQRIKILLVVPNFRWKKSSEHILWPYLPYGLCLIASIIENDYDVKILDAYADDLSEMDFIQKIREEKPQVVGISVLMDYFGETAHLAAKLVKNCDNHIINVIGGIYATTNIEKVIKDENFDYLIAGEGEYCFRNLLNSITRGEKPDDSGIYYYQDNMIQGKGKAVPVDNLDELPLPAYHLLNFDQYSNNTSRDRVDSFRSLPYADIMTSRGCPYHCCFCQVNYISGRNFRARSAENVLDEVDWLIKNYGIKSVVFNDDNFFADKNRAKKIMEGMMARKLEWKTMVTAIFLLDDELIMLMKKSGCNFMDIAIESGSQRVLKEIIHKPIILDKVKILVRKAQEVGIYVAANFIIGFPNESWDEIMQTIRFAEEINIDYAKFFIATPLPHTEMYDEAKKLKCILPEYDSENIDWKAGVMQTDQFTINDLTILRAYEWDRINFTNSEKRKRTAEMMNVTEQRLNEIRKETRASIKHLIRKDI